MVTIDSLVTSCVLGFCRQVDVTIETPLGEGLLEQIADVAFGHLAPAPLLSAEVDYHPSNLHSGNQDNRRKRARPEDERGTPCDEITYAP